MKVLLISNYRSDKQYSMLGFSKALENGLASGGISVTNTYPVNILLKRNQPPKIKKWIAYIDKYVLFPKTLKTLASKHDLVHICDHGNSMYVNQLTNVPTLVTCHDMLAIRGALGEIPGWPIGKSGQTYQKLILNGLKKATHVASVSEATHQGVIRIAQRNPETCSVVYNGLYRKLSRLDAKTAKGRLSSTRINFDQPFLLHVGGNQPYKNREGAMLIIDSFLSQQHEGWQGILAGHPLDRKRFDVYNLLPNKERIHVVSGLNDGEIEALYSLAKAFIFPSTAEGFGLPILEAQSCGCPVVTTNREPMREVAGNAAVLIHPENSRANIQASAQAVPTDEDQVQDLVQKGYENIKSFTTEKMIEGYISTYKRILSGQTTAQVQSR